MRQNQDVIREKIANDDFIDGIFHEWYITHLRQMHEWLKCGLINMKNANLLYYKFEKSDKSQVKPLFRYIL